MTTFGDLIFEQVPSFRGVTKMKATHYFDNGYGASVITEISDDGDEESYELAVLLNGEITTDTYITDDVLCGLTIDEVTNVLQTIEDFY